MKSLSVSSREGQANYLCDGSDQYWTGSGVKHWIRLEMQLNVLVTKLTMVSVVILDVAVRCTTVSVEIFANKFDKTKNLI